MSRKSEELVTAFEQSVRIHTRLTATGNTPDDTDDEMLEISRERLVKYILGLEATSIVPN
jgi:hypothetical protein